MRKLLLLPILALVLTACGSSYGGGGDSGKPGKTSPTTTSSSGY
ncbi:MAG: hypothetical protein QOE36_1060 [Gaiellaceae bacterium]|jgi:hypothetical protein|nr:hypothetical protein [Gaiellaceae bacterium]